MRLRVPVLVALMFSIVRAAAAQTGPPPSASPVQAETNKSSVSFYGFARLDVIFDDSRINAFQTPTFVRSEADGAENRGNFTMHPRLTRFGVNYRAPQIAGGPVVGGRLEIDFQNGGSNSRAIPRYRHAFLQMNWGVHSLLAGQTWDVISPLYPTANADTMMWNVGNMGDRRPQLRYSYEPKAGLNVRAGIGLTGAIDNLDADNNGVPDGEGSQMPNLQGRVGYNTSNTKAANAFYRFECALRSSAILGFFGFPTLGYFIAASFENLLYGEVWTYLYVLFALVAIADWWSGALRRRFVA